MHTTLKLTSKVLGSGGRGSFGSHVGLNFDVSFQLITMLVGSARS